MKQSEGLRDRKKRETQAHILAVATRLFLVHGFDQVTIAEIAAAANVAKMTVFNYFARKEDLYFDRLDESIARIKGALDARKRSVSPVRAIQRLAHDLLDEHHPFAALAPSRVAFWQLVEESPALLARAREIAEELSAVLANQLAASVGKEPDGVAWLLARSIVVTWQSAYAESLRAQRSNQSKAKVRAAFVDLVDRGFDMIAYAARGTPYRD